MTNGHHMNKSESPSPKDDLDQVWLKLPQWFWRRRFFFFVFLHFRYYLPLEMTNGHHVNKSESPFPKDDLGQVWLKLAQWFWRRFFISIFPCIFTFWLLPPLENNQWSSYEQIGIPFPQGWFGPCLVEIGPVFLEKKIFFYFSVYFYIFATISPWKWPIVIIWTNLNPFPPMMIWTKFDWNWPTLVHL